MKKVYSAIVAYLFFSQIYTGWKILIGFVYSSRPVGLRAILMSFLSFWSQKTYPGEFVGMEVILRRSYLRKCGIWLGPLPITNLSFFENAIKFEPLGVRG